MDTLYEGEEEEYEEREQRGWGRRTLPFIFAIQTFQESRAGSGHHQQAPSQPKRWVKGGLTVFASAGGLCLSAYFNLNLQVRFNVYPYVRPLTLSQSYSNNTWGKTALNGIAESSFSLLNPLDSNLKQNYYFQLAEVNAHLRMLTDSSGVQCSLPVLCWHYFQCAEDNNTISSCKRVKLFEHANVALAS